MCIFVRRHGAGEDAIPSAVLRRRPRSQRCARRAANRRQPRLASCVLEEWVGRPEVPRRSTRPEAQACVVADEVGGQTSPNCLGYKSEWRRKVTPGSRIPGGRGSLGRRSPGRRGHAQIRRRPRKRGERARGGVPSSVGVHAVSEVWLQAGGQRRRLRAVQPWQSAPAEAMQPPSMRGTMAPVAETPASGGSALPTMTRAPPAPTQPPPICQALRPPSQRRRPRAVQLGRRCRARRQRACNRPRCQAQRPPTMQASLRLCHVALGKKRT